MPIYETKDDLLNEKSVIDFISGIRPYTFRKLPQRYALDYALIQDGDVVGWAEIKCRSCASTDYADAMVSFFKVKAALELSRVSGLPAHLIVRWTDMTGVINFYSDHQVRTGGRSDRGDTQDIDVCAYYPIAGFQKLDPIC